jgi:hypothetical protein
VLTARRPASAKGAGVRAGAREGGAEESPVLSRIRFSCLKVDGLIMKDMLDVK